MSNGFEYYYNNVPGKGLCRNNLIYTSLISKDRKTFCQWYYNDKTYHSGMNKVVDPTLMLEKWQREKHYLLLMHENFPQHIPEILDIDDKNQKIYLRIDGDDFWERAKTDINRYNDVLPNWEEQMLEIIESHKKLNFYKISMHPSSYFVVDGKLKSINYFFCYNFSEETIRFSDVFSHISDDRLEKLYPLMKKMNIDYNNQEPLEKIQNLAFETFKFNFPHSTMEKAKRIYV